MFYFYIINYFLLFLIMNSTWAHINSTFIIFYYEQYPRAHMNSAPGPRMNSTSGPTWGHGSRERAESWRFSIGTQLVW